MIHWQETAEIVARLAELAAAGESAALATVVQIAGSAYRRPGAKLLIEKAGYTVGSVSGGCLEADVREVAMTVLDTGRPWLRHYETGDEDVVWGLGLGCNGHVDVFVQPATSGPLGVLAGRIGPLFAGDARFAVATVVGEGNALGGMLLIEADGTAHGALAAAACSAGAAAAGGTGVAANRTGAVASGTGAVACETLVAPSGTLVADACGAALERAVTARARALLISGGGSRLETIEGAKVFFEVMAPPPHLIVCGGGEDAKPLVACASDAGFRVTLVDHRAAMLAAEHFPRAARRLLARPEDPEVTLPPAGRSLAVIKTHSLAHDREWVRRLLAAGVPYIGVLGPRGRTDSILRAVGAGPDAAERVFGPVGLDLGADGPRQVAISIVAELLAWNAGRTPRHLSERREAIHAG